MLSAFFSLAECKFATLRPNSVIRFAPEWGGDAAQERVPPFCRLLNCSVFATQTKPRATNPRVISLLRNGPGILSASLAITLLSKPVRGRRSDPDACRRLDSVSNIGSSIIWGLSESRDHGWLTCDASCPTKGFLPSGRRHRHDQSRPGPPHAQLARDSRSGPPPCYRLDRRPVAPTSIQSRWTSNAALSRKWTVIAVPISLTGQLRAWCSACRNAGGP